MASSLFHRFHARCARGAQVLLLASCVVALAGCMSVSTQKIGMVPVAAADPVYTIQLSRLVIASLPDESSVTLRSGSQWRRVGALPQGDVYRAQDGLFTIQTRRQGEAYLVASSGRLLGFYLPGESAYLPLTRPVTLPVEMRQ
ncbi:hypothetical protein D3C87_1701420 [compost metagenome]